MGGGMCDDMRGGRSVPGRAGCGGSGRSGSVARRRMGGKGMIARAGHRQIAAFPLPRRLDCLSRPGIVGMLRFEQIQYPLGTIRRP